MRPKNAESGPAGKGDGEGRGVDTLLPEAYEELHTLAEGYMRQERPDHTLRPTALINEAYMRLAGRESARWKDRSQFLAVAAQAMRRVLVDHAKYHQRKKRTGDRKRMPLHDTMLLCEERNIDVLALDEALSDLQTINPEHARLVELRFFAGLTIEETAKTLGVSTSSVERTWRCARAWLFRRLSKGDTHLAESDR